MRMRPGEERVQTQQSGVRPSDKRRTSRATPNTTTVREPLLFPEFLCGEQAPTRRKMKAEAKKWGRRFAKGLEFPEPKLIPVPPGSIVFDAQPAVEFMKWGVSTENDPEWEKVCALRGRLVPRWHLHHLAHFWSEIPTVDESREGRDMMFNAYEKFVLRYPWGALVIAMTRPLYPPDSRGYTTN